METLPYTDDPQIAEQQQRPEVFTVQVNRSGWYIPPRIHKDEPDPVESQRLECFAQIQTALPHVRERRLVIQAGGRVGLWPHVLSVHFEKVITLEPDRVNFECLQANLAANHPNVVAFDAALGRSKRFAYLNPSELSSGEHFIRPLGERPDRHADKVQMISIDELMREETGHVDAIFLDVEGYELEAIAGASAVLREDRPTLILEENDLGGRYGVNRGDLERALAPLGYRQVGEYAKLPPEIQHNGEFHGADLIFAV